MHKLIHSDLVTLWKARDYQYLLVSLGKDDIYSVTIETLYCILYLLKVLVTVQCCLPLQ